MMKTSIEIFKTNVLNRPVAAKLVQCLEALLLEAKVNFDLEDCDHILRVETPETIDATLVRNCIAHHGYKAEPLQ
ncbi:hypothetical protein LL912_16290 [Niabella sp. CC-SYL272]|uniref:hypothetical protein n=1 Tax=Niabella agricola TaxID=2891571 RepID=UPI001F449285|nr:hypothetical protein [Niabella agricola]MCF3110345.1 hypothetical protein [Niabella agricola]